MFRPVELAIGLRYTHSRRGNSFISFISIISMLGIALGVAALITVLSVMNGFEHEVRERMLKVASHATISGLDGSMGDWKGIARAAAEHGEVRGVAPYVRGQAMLSHAGEVSGALIRGMLPQHEKNVSELETWMVAGSLQDLQPGEWHVVLGTELAAALGVGIGDKVTLITPKAAVTPAGIVPRLKRFTVSGLFEVGMYEYDRNMAWIHMNDGSKVFGLGDRITGVRLKLDDLFRAPEVVRSVAMTLPDVYLVNDWTRQHSNLFRAIATEKRIMFIILVLIVAVAAFNIVSTLVMAVTDKQADIAILRTLGASRGAILRMFMIQGSLIGVIGTLVGLVAGVALALNVETVVPAIEQAFNIKFLPADVYPVSDLPSELHWEDVIRTGSVAFALSLLATLYPSWRAASVQPAEALRYE